jgi:hypothetical protein
MLVKEVQPSRSVLAVVVVAKRRVVRVSSDFKAIVAVWCNKLKRLRKFAVAEVTRECYP